jgi:uncharacterized protein YktB (UPF0637 family)
MWNFIFRKKKKESKQLLQHGIKVKRIVRERLSVIHFIKTDYAEYFVYNTQTIKEDWVNIEIERVDFSGKKELVCEQQIFDESFGAMGGDSFTTLVMRALADLKDLIKEKREYIIEDKKIN